ncbi:MAG: hypothetical protein R3Y59_11050 [bacterium]
MYYNREISPELEDLLITGELKWLVRYIREHDDLDLLIGRNKSKEFCSVYRGTSRFLSIERSSFKKAVFKVTASNTYKKLCPELFSDSLSDITPERLEKLRNIVSNDSHFDRYYNNKKEGYYQNYYSRKYGLLSSELSEFVVVDKESVVGYEDENEKNKQFAPIQRLYLDVREKLCASAPELYGKHFANKKDGTEKEKSLGSELDLLALDKNGNILLIELKDGGNTNGIYLSPFQIGVYYDAFSQFSFDELFNTVIRMAKQKQRLNLISPDWKIPQQPGKMVAELVIGGKCSKAALDRFESVKEFIKKDNEKLLKDICVKHV